MSSEQQQEVKSASKQVASTTFLEAKKPISWKVGNTVHLVLWTQISLEYKPALDTDIFSSISQEELDILDGKRTPNGPAPKGNAKRIKLD
jgi:hypothetical protein